ncbi:ribosome biogenesis GTP-binding protein YihA/YsxC [[Mycoplasma] gypis]|uniref:Probable GTP-binding protein EngB n=1 Tax=[Mycoplasma] gypis TaxID=92404 RepID=A0ABZ2RMC9_9BACT|nr:ribosome biogenesis GTP-binding protein YihA/YsxC [[Mycoplasma] gypis]MBN0919098.1 YihA family ribosome biogenesis GTP-binding protein [[Mycoplasma] gypis]
MWTFIKSADKKDSWYQHNQKEIAFWGRSNVGKSSLLNALANQKIAKVSSTPGRTRLLNYFQSDKGTVIVDLPGYGYAKMSVKEQAYIGNMIGTYLQQNKNLDTLCILIDSKIGITPIDSEMIDFCMSLNLKVDLIFTKSDKANQSQMHRTKADLKNLYNNIESTFVSSKTRKNIDKIIEKYNI